MLIFWLFLALFIYLMFVFYKQFYFISVDNTLMFSGAPGTSKTLNMVKMGKKLFRINKAHVKRKNFFARIFGKEQHELPEMYSNFPVRLGRYKWKEYVELVDDLVSQGYVVIAKGITPKDVVQLIKEHYQEDEYIEIDRTKFCKPLKIEHLLNQERLNYKSVVLLTEIGKIASQYDWQNLNVQQHMDDFVSMYRQYTQGGYFLCDDQSSDNVVVAIRRRLGTVINCLHFRKFWKFYWVKMRNITVSEDIKTIEDESAEDNMRWHLSMFPLFHRDYDTYFGSNRYNTVPRGQDSVYTGFKTNAILKVPSVKVTRYMGQESVEGLLPKKIRETDDIKKNMIKRF